MIKGSDICSNSSTALTGANDLDAVARAQLRLRPSGARDNGTIDCYRNSALPGVDRLFLQQCRQGRGGERLVLAVDADARPGSGLRHCILPHSAAARSDPNRSMPNGRIAGSATPSSTSRAIASAVIGVSKMPLR